MQLGGSIAAILMLAGIAWWLRLGRDGRIIGPEEAADAADHALGGFRTADAVVGADGMAALAVDAGAVRLAVCKRRGARVAVCEVGWGAIRSTPAGIVVETGDRRFGRVPVKGVDALDMRRLAGDRARGAV
ncbi:hypothetical protein [uncultured Sphingomonas sp.]|uniref:hypothetical protein n=1 Tax=uncultured Sphingomonas sp. TaxID=158754 RepID=UPI0035CBB6CC